MAVVRCPECGRAGDGALCLACGYEWPQEGAAPAAAAPAAPTSPAKNPFASGASTGAAAPAAPPPNAKNPFATGASTGATNPLGSAPASSVTTVPGPPAAPAAPAAPPSTPVGAAPPDAADPFAGLDLSPGAAPAGDTGVSAVLDEITAGLDDAPLPAGLERPTKPATPAPPPERPSPSASGSRGSPLDKLPPIPQLGAAAGGGFLVTLLVGLALVFSGGSDGPDMSPAEADAAISRIDAIEDADRTNADWVTLGHAHAVLGNKGDALDAYRDAARRDAIDDAAQAYTLKMLSEPLLTDKAARVLIEVKSSDVDEALRELTSSDVSFTRHAALRTLDRRGTGTVELKVRVALTDLLTEKKCDDRRKALLLLERSAQGRLAEDAIEALKTIEDRKMSRENNCMLPDLQRVTQKLLNAI